MVCPPKQCSGALNLQPSGGLLTFYYLRLNTRARAGRHPNFHFMLHILSHANSTELYSLVLGSVPLCFLPSHWHLSHANSTELYSLVLGSVPLCFLPSHWHLSQVIHIK
jgi:hypothetical protein